jgi:hypothetical protein
MKKILFLLLVSMLLIPGAFAATEETEEKLVPQRTSASTDRLVEIESRRLSSKMDDIERRLRDLERYQRSQDDRMRSLERSINDVKRLRS